MIFIWNPLFFQENFNSFQYWRPILPDIDLELELLQQFEPASSASLKKTKTELPGEEWNSFNYWRTPIPEIDLDLDSL